MNETLGARLRDQREQRQVTLATISAQTKIKMTLLEALESDDVSQWPKGLFARAYVRDYARAVGLDPEAIVAEFLALHPEFAQATADAEEAAETARQEAARSPTAKLRRFVNAAFSGMPARVAASPARELTHPTAEPYEVPPAEELPPPVESVRHTFSLELDSAHDEPALAEPPPTLAAQPLRMDTTLAAVADVCARMARAIDWRDLTTLLADAARVLDAAGVIVWQWDPSATALRPSLAYGYAQSVLARLPDVTPDAANAVAAAYRSGERCVVGGADGGTEAVVVPSMGVSGCVGVLAVELRPGAKERESICAFATILAAQLAMLLPPVPEPAVAALAV